MAIFETGALREAKCCRRLRGSTLRRAFHGLTPTAKCCRRLRGSVGIPRAGARGLSLFKSSPIRRMAIFETGALREAKCCRRLRGSTLRRAFHGLTPTAKCCRRLRGSVGSPGLAPGDYHYLNRRPSGVWQFLRQGLSVGLSAAAAAQHCAELSMGSRPRLSAAAAFAAQRDGGIRLSMGSRPAKCCRRLSMGWARPRLSAAAAFAAQHCAELSMGSRPRLSAAAAFAAFWNPRTDSRGIINQKSCPCSARGPSYPPPAAWWRRTFFPFSFSSCPFVVLRAPSWISFCPLCPFVD